MPCATQQSQSGHEQGEALPTAIASLTADASGTTVAILSEAILARTHAALNLTLRLEVSSTWSLADTVNDVFTTHSCYGAATGENDMHTIAEHDPFKIPIEKFIYVYYILQVYDAPTAQGLMQTEHYYRTMPHLKQLVSKFDGLLPDDKLKAREHGRDTFIKYLGFVRSQLEKLAATQNLTIKRLAVTIPPDWDRQLQLTYLNFLSNVWGDLKSNDIVLVYEPEAASHYLLHEHRLTRERQPKRMVLADFGDRVLSISVFEVTPHREGNCHTLFELIQGERIYGGSELHASYVRQKIESHLAGSVNTTKRTRELSLRRLLKDYRQTHQNSINGCEFTVQEMTNWNASGLKVSIQSPQAKEWFETCFRVPITRLEEELLKFIPTASDTTVVLTGRSFANEHVKHATQEAINAIGISYLDWTQCPSAIDQRSSNIAAGAALALANLTPTTTLLKTFVFAAEITNDGQSEKTPIIWKVNGSGGASRELHVPQQSDVYIMSYPCASEDLSEILAEQSCFRLLQIKDLDQGTYMISMHLEELQEADEGARRLVLSISKPTAGQESVTDVYNPLLYYDPIYGTYLIDVDASADITMGGEDSAVPELVLRHWKRPEVVNTVQPEEQATLQAMRQDHNSPNGHTSQHDNWQGTLSTNCTNDGGTPCPGPRHTFKMAHPMACSLPGYISNGSPPPAILEPNSSHTSPVRSPNNMEYVSIERPANGSHRNNSQRATNEPRVDENASMNQILQESIENDSDTTNSTCNGIERNSRGIGGVSFDIRHTGSSTSIKLRIPRGGSSSISINCR